MGTSFIELAAKVGLGTAFYLAVLWVARRSPRASGTMLTFPALNGLALVMADPAALDATVRPMLLMPVLNGVLCAAFVSAFASLVAAGWPARRASAVLAAAFAASWLAGAEEIARRGWGVPHESQALYWLAAAITGAGLTAAGRHRAAGASARSPPQPLPDLIRGNLPRILLFAASLAAVVLAAASGGAPGLLAVLGSLPLVALFALHTLAAGTAVPASVRDRALASVAAGIPIGPAIAIGFVAVLWRVLAALAQHLSGTLYLAAGIAALLAGWGSCLAVIWAAGSLAPTKGRARTP